jgi:hypothetical protein
MSTPMTRFLAAVVLLAVRPLAAAADHGGPLREAPMSPLTVGLLAGGAVLATGVLVVIIVMALTRKSGE